MSQPKIERDTLDRAERAVDEWAAKIKANIAQLRGDPQPEVREIALELREDWSPEEYEQEAAAFYWWEKGAYRVVILRENAKRGPREKREVWSQRQCFELWATTPEKLRDIAHAIGWDLGDIEKIRADCDAHIHGRR